MRRGFGGFGRGLGLGMRGGRFGYGRGGYWYLGRIDDNDLNFNSKVMLCDEN